MSVAVQTISLHSPSPATSASSVPLPSAALEHEDSLGQLRSTHAFPRRTTPSFTLGSRPQSRVYSGSIQRSYRTSFITSARSTALATICSDCKILSCLLDFLSYQDFRSLNATSRAIRRIFIDASVKDVVFARFIPGYRAALRWRDSRMWEDSIRLNYTDLSLLGECPALLSILSPSATNYRCLAHHLSRVTEYASSPLSHACPLRPLK